MDPSESLDSDASKTVGSSTEVGVGRTTKDAEGGEFGSVAGVTEKTENGSEVPATVLTAISRKPIAASAAIEMVIGISVAVPPLSMVAVTPMPLNVIEVAPVRLSPKSVAEMV